MRLSFACAVAALVLTLTACSSTAPSRETSEIRQDAQRFSEQLERALSQRDEQTLQSLIGPDFEFVHSTGRIENRESFVRRAAAGQLAPQNNPGELLEQRMRADGHVAVRTVVTAVSLPSADATRAARIVTVYVYSRSAGEWRWISAQSTLVAQQ